jgi:hypothetical protein
VTLIDVVVVDVRRRRHVRVHLAKLVVTHPHCVIVTSETFHQEEESRSEHDGGERKENSGFAASGALVDVAGDGDADQERYGLGSLKTIFTNSQL